MRSENCVYCSFIVAFIVITECLFFRCASYVSFRFCPCDLEKNRSLFCYYRVLWSIARESNGTGRDRPSTPLRFAFGQRSGFRIISARCSSIIYENCANVCSNIRPCWRMIDRVKNKSVESRPKFAELRCKIQRRFFFSLQPNDVDVSVG